MRLIARIAANRFISMAPFSRKNTKVQVIHDDIKKESTARLLLWGHEIATLVRGPVDDTIKLNLCGYPTTTTKSRLNALLHLLQIRQNDRTAWFHTKKGQLYFGEISVSSRDTLIVTRRRLTSSRFELIDIIRSDNG